MPIKRLNYTSRRKLTRDQVRIRLSPNGDGRARTFEADLNLPSDLPGDARVFVEAYRSSPAARMRFDFGTADAVRPPSAERRRLTDFDDGLRPPLFRVKVTDVGERPGKLLADAHRIRPLDPDEHPDRRRGILYISWRENNGPVWELDFDDARGPQMFIDRTADPNHELPDRAEFKALVYPEVIRRALSWVLIHHEGALIEDTSTWHGQWLYFPRDSFGFTEQPPAPDDDMDEKHAWIDAAVRFCSRKAEFCRALAPKEDE